MAKHIMLNSEIIPSSSPCLYNNNRGLLYGDSFSFELRGNSSKAFFTDTYFDYMVSTMKLMGMEKPQSLKKSIFTTDLELILQKNRIYKGFYAIISVFRNSIYNNSVSILISVDPLPNEYYTINEKGLKVDVYKKQKISPYIFDNSIFPIFNFEYTLRKEIEEKNIDNFLLLDENSNIVKAIDSNILFVKNGHIITPSNFINNNQKTFSLFVLDTAVKCNIPVVTANIKEKDLINLDEIFFINPIYGINWVLAFKEKRYYNKVSSNLINLLNKYLNN